MTPNQVPTPDFLTDYVAPTVNMFSSGQNFSIFNFFINTFFVILLIYLFIYILRYFTQSKQLASITGNILRTIPLRQNASVTLLEVGNRVLVLGVTNTKVNCLETITDEKEIDLIKRSSSLVSDEVGGLQKLFHLFKRKESKFEPLINRSIHSILQDSDNIENLGKK
jgi:flagellar biogenesis protein FliO